MSSNLAGCAIIKISRRKGWFRLGFRRGESPMSAAIRQSCFGRLASISRDRESTGTIDASGQSGGRPRAEGSNGSRLLSLPDAKGRMEERGGAAQGKADLALENLTAKNCVEYRPPARKAA